MKVAIYARVSTHDQQTLEMQIEAMKKHAVQRGWQVVKEIQEVGSGAIKRPKREALLKSARRREVDGIIVWKLDRWGRSVPDLISTLNELQETGVGFISITEALDLTTSAGRAMAGILAVFAEFERDMLRERVKAGLEQARRKGKKLGRPATAMAKADKVRELYGQKLSKSEIARRLGIDRSSVRRALQELDES